MAQLPDEVINMIYTYEHQLSPWDVMRELLMRKTNCVLNVQMGQAFRMRYRHPDGSLRPCITIDRIEASSSELLQMTRNRTRKQ
eukprot:15469913-Alexandrium_andersonii.AAC.1